MTSRDQADKDAIAILHGDAPPITDDDPRSQSEREINRTWSALRRAGDHGLIETEPAVRRHLNSTWPELRVEALKTLCRWGRADPLERAREIAADSGADETERVFAIEALASQPVAGNKDRAEVQSFLLPLTRDHSGRIAEAAAKASAALA